MLGLLRKLFGAKPETVEAVAPYKIEAPTPAVEVKAEVKPAKKTAKKPAVKKATTQKPRKPKAKA